MEYRSSGLWELDLAWATTVHKAQGGESPVVVLMLSNSHRPLLTRRLLYTGPLPSACCLLRGHADLSKVVGVRAAGAAVILPLLTRLFWLAALTRAKKLVVVVGPEKAIQTAVSEVKGDMRLSSLQPRLQVSRHDNVMHLRPMLEFAQTSRTLCVLKDARQVLRQHVCRFLNLQVACAHALLWVHGQMQSLRHCAGASNQAGCGSKGAAAVWLAAGAQPGGSRLHWHRARGQFGDGCRHCCRRSRPGRRRARRRSRRRCPSGDDFRGRADSVSELNLVLDSVPAIEAHCLLHIVENSQDMYALPRTARNSLHLAGPGAVCKSAQRQAAEQGAQP